MKYIPLNIPVEDRIPEGYHLVQAYAKGDNIVVPITDIPEGQEDLHNCDWEGCGSMDCVVRFNVVEKYRHANASHSLTTEEAEALVYSLVCSVQCVEHMVHLGGYAGEYQEEVRTKKAALIAALTGGGK
jgi:hypothetical protein